MKYAWVWWCVVAAAAALRVLVVFPVPSRSHAALGDGYVRHLLGAGHHVTYVTPYPWARAPARLRQVDVGATRLPDMYNISAIMSKQVDLQAPSNTTRFMNALSEATILNENVQQLLNDPREAFDVVVVEWLFSDTYCGFSVVFECPFIWSSSMDPHPFILSLVDEAASPALTPGFLSANVPPFTFAQRVQELIGYLSAEIFRLNFGNYEKDQYKRWFGPILAKRGRPLPPYEEVKYNASLVLGNSHASVGQAVRLPQSYKPIAGYHIDNRVRPLPKDLKIILDDADNGFIYFSMGSILKSRDFPARLIHEILEMLGQLKRTVVWKFEDEGIKPPPNVYLVKWAPQQSILAHRHCALFVSHGGLLSTTEAVHFGVPMVGVPAYADQFVNINKAVKNQFARKVDLSYSLAKDLKEAIEDVLYDKRYSKKVKELSMVYHDRPLPPAQELVFWVEHVARTRGAPHLRSPALALRWYQKTYLDLVLILLIILICIVMFVRKLISFISRDAYSRKKKET